MRFPYHAPAKPVSVCLLFLLTLSLSSWAAEKQTLRFGVTVDHPLLPVARELFENMYAEVGYEIDIIHMPHRRNFKAANSGRELDGVLLQVEEVMAGFDNLVRVEEPFYEVKSFVWSRAGAPAIEVDGWASIKPYRIGINQQKLYGISRTRDFDRIVAKDAAQLIKILIGGRVDLIVLTAFEGYYYGNMQGEAHLRRLEPALYSTPLYHYLHRKHIELAPRIGRRLKALSDKGEISRVIEHHMTIHHSGH